MSYLYMNNNLRNSASKNSEFYSVTMRQFWTSCALTLRISSISENLTKIPSNLKIAFKFIFLWEPEKLFFEKYCISLHIWIVIRRLFPNKVYFQLSFWKKTVNKILMGLLVIWNWHHIHLKLHWNIAYDWCN